MQSLWLTSNAFSPMEREKEPSKESSLINVSADRRNAVQIYRGYKIFAPILPYPVGYWIVEKDGTRICSSKSESEAKRAIDELLG